MARAKILVVDDDTALLRALRVGLAASGFEVVIAHNGKEGIAQAVRHSPDVVVLDLGLPDIDGMEVCRRIRAWSNVPIIVLSAAGEEQRKVRALDAGADDYVTKPFGMAELAARVRTALRRAAAGTTPLPEGATIALGRLEVDLVHREVRLNGRLVHLTSREFDLLCYLVRHRGKTCTHQMLLGAVWGPGYGAEPQYLHVYVNRLRRKLDDVDGTLIRTARGIGYALSAGGPPGEQADD